ncbi:MAG: hypothetical protein AB7V34_01705 [Brachymonas sp.]
MKRVRTCLLMGALCGAGASACAFTATIKQGSKALYLQVGTGTMSGTNTTVNLVSATLSMADVTSGSAVTMTSDSPITTSPYDGWSFCNVPQQVYVGGFNRYKNKHGSSASLSVSAPSALTNAAGDTISFGTISWTVSGNGDTVNAFPDGSFTPGGTVFLYTMPANQWAEGCMAFSYSNASVVGAGTYIGRVTYTLTVP